MGEIEQFVTRARAYAARKDMAISTLSRHLLGNGVRIDELERGGSLRVDTLAKAKATLTRLEQAA